MFARVQSTTFPPLSIILSYSYFWYQPFFIYFFAIVNGCLRELSQLFSEQVHHGTFLPFSYCASRFFRLQGVFLELFKAIFIHGNPFCSPYVCVVIFLHLFYAFFRNHNYLGNHFYLYWAENFGFKSFYLFGIKV